MIRDYILTFLKQVAQLLLISLPPRFQLFIQCRTNKTWFDYSQWV